jgi:hypothetical protein
MMVAAEILRMSHTMSTGQPRLVKISSWSASAGILFARS